MFAYLDLTGFDPVGYETLDGQWTHPGLGMVLPGAFEAQHLPGLVLTDPVYPPNDTF